MVQKQNAMITLKEMEYSVVFDSIPEREYRSFFANIFKHWHFIKEFVATGDTTSIEVELTLDTDNVYKFTFSIDNAAALAYNETLKYRTPDAINEQIYTFEFCKERGILTLDKIEFDDVVNGEAYELIISNWEEFVAIQTGKVFIMNTFPSVSTQL